VTSEKADAYLSRYTYNRSERRKKEYDSATGTVLEVAVGLLGLSAPRIYALPGMLEPRVRKTGGNRAGSAGSRWNRSGPVHEPV
jgi:hypothetical protein